MEEYSNREVDNWRSKERYSVSYSALKECDNLYSFDIIRDILAGKYGFMCQYDRKNDEDTVWSVIYDVKNNGIYRVEGNPNRKAFKKDTRMKFKE